MMPILHEAVADLIHNSIDYNKGITKLPYCIECNVHEVLNGAFDLSLKYPVGEFAWNEIYPGRIIIAKASELDSDNTQPFTIRKVTRNGNMLNVTAQHISYRLKGVLVPPITTGLSTLALIRDYINNNAVNNPFTFYSDAHTAIAEPITTKAPQSIYNLLYGGSNSIAKAFNGMYELRFNRLNVAMQTARGSAKDFSVSYGKNMLSFATDAVAEDKNNRVWPYANLPKNAENKEKVYLDLTTVGAAAVVSHGTLGYEAFAVPADVTEQFAETDYYDDLVSTAAKRLQTRNKLQTYAEKWALKNDTDFPDSITLSYIDLARTTEYSFLQRTKIGIGDTIKVKYPMYGIDRQMEVKELTYDVLRDSNKTVIVGTPAKTVVDKIAAKLREGDPA